MLIQNGFIVDGINRQVMRGNVFIQKDIITAIDYEQGSDASDDVIDATDCYVIPGLIDTHFHGCVGYDFCDANKAAYRKMEEYQLHHGITSILPATTTLAKDRLIDTCKEAAEYYRESDCFLGLHLEGPFLASDKKGAQNGEYLCEPDVNLLIKLQLISDGLIRIVTMAPELAGAVDCIEKYHSRARELFGKGNEPRVQFSIGHTMADYDTAVSAIKKEMGHITHLYNGMPAFSHRSPGVVGAAMDEGAMVELIADGVHVHESVIRSTFRMFGEDKVILVSDSMMATGMSDGDYSLGGLPVKVEGRYATLEDGTLAGSVTNLFACLKNTVQSGVLLPVAVRAATYNAAEVLRMENVIGSIETGKQADILVVKKSGEGILGEIRHVIKNGVKVY